MKKSKLLKRILLPVFVLMISIFLFAPQAQASTKSKALKAYKRYLTNYTIQWGHWCSVYTDEVKFTLVYVDNNSVPELLVYAPTNGRVYGYWMLCTYKNGKVKPLATSEEFGYYRRTGIFKAIGYGQGKYVYVYKLHKGKAIVKLKSSRSLWNKNPYRTYYYKVFKDKHAKITKKKITKSTYNNTLKKLAKGKKMSGIKIKTYKNTSYNRSKYLK